MRPLLLVAAVAVAAVAFGTGTATAATPCWKQIYNDWYDNGKIDRTYPIHCYREALAKLPEDARDYTSLGDDISAAMQAALHPNSRHTQASAGSNDTMGRGTGDPMTEKPRQTYAQPSQDLVSRGLDDAGSNSAEAIPLPLIVLAGLGGALLAAGAAGAGRRKLVAWRASRQ